jgi:branched-subunit amino acid transport protein
MNEMLLILGMALATMATRIPVLVWFSKRKMPAGLLRALRYVPPAVLAAIIVPEVFVRGGELSLSLDSPTLLASAIAVLISWRTSSLLLTILVGMAAFFLFRSFL